MKKIHVRGCGAVSPAGWGAEALLRAVTGNEVFPHRELKRPGQENPLRVCSVPPPAARPAFLAHPRLRRSSAITQYALSASLEALGQDAALARAGQCQIGLVVCVMSGCVNYSRRFYEETLGNPETASPLVFPETVFNAPASHIAAFLGSSAINYTLIGGPGAFLQGLALAGEWLTEGRVDGCLVVGSEEIDWLTADALYRFSKNAVFSEGAGALYLKADPSPGARLEAVTNPHTLNGSGTRAAALQAMRSELPPAGPTDLLFDSRRPRAFASRAETQLWLDRAGPRHSVKAALGEGLMAASAWQCVAAAKALEREAGPAAVVSVAGFTQQAIAARFTNE